MKLLKSIAVITALVATAALLGYIARRQPKCPLYTAVMLQQREKDERRAERVLFLHRILQHVLSALNWATAIDISRRNLWPKAERSEDE